MSDIADLVAKSSNAVHPTGSGVRVQVDRG